MSEPSVVEALVGLGFNTNDGRVYASLLEGGPSTGYEVGQRSGVPRSAVYNVLRRLVTLGAARSEGGSPERFVATPADSLLALLRRRFDRTGDAFEQAVARLEVAPTTAGAFNIVGYERIIEEAVRIVERSERVLVVSGWPRELDELAEALAAAEARGVLAVVFAHAAIPESLAGLHYSYGLEEQDLEAFWDHKLVVVGDDSHSLIGATARAADDTAVVSETRAIAEFATGQVAMDITLLAQRHDHDTSAVMGRILGDRVGRLDDLLVDERPPLLGRGTIPKAPKRRRKARKKKG